MLCPVVYVAAKKNSDCQRGLYYQLNLTRVMCYEGRVLAGREGGALWSARYGSQSCGAAACEGC